MLYVYSVDDIQYIRRVHAAGGGHARVAVGAVAGFGDGRAGQWDREPVGGPVLAAAAPAAEPAGMQRVERARREARRRSHRRRPVRATASAGTMWKLCWGGWPGNVRVLRTRNLPHGGCGLRSELGRERLSLREQVSRSAALEYYHRQHEHQELRTCRTEHQSIFSTHASRKKVRIPNRCLINYYAAVLRIY